MKNLLSKKPVIFAVILIVIYVVGANVMQFVSDAVKIKYFGEMIFNIAFSAFLFGFAKKNGLCGLIGLKISEVSAAKMLFYIPLAMIAFDAAFFGIEFDLTAELAVRTVHMLFVGFVEEVIFRGFLFKGIAKENVTKAIVISAVTFGIGHIVNLFSGQQDIFATVTQIIFAVGCGFMLVMIYVRTDSIISCIVFHSINNMTNGFADGKLLTEALGEQNAQLVLLGGGLVIMLGYTLYVVKCVPKRGITQLP